jgi:2-keto-4-pentenoate hydratase/2-oxohepta-3-ene-1,7-dioic acid hydratase in catechol pathway
MGTTGFPLGKGGDGMLPIGPLLVVPAAGDGYYPKVELALYVNGRKRQGASASLMLWSPREIVDRALDACADSYETPQGSIGLTACGGIPAGTLLLTGTPAGVAFHPLNLWRPGAYLTAGDEVITTGTGLGVLRNPIE